MKRTVALEVAGTVSSALKKREKEGGLKKKRSIMFIVMELFDAHDRLSLHKLTVLSSLIDSYCSQCMQAS